MVHLSETASEVRQCLKKSLCWPRLRGLESERAQIFNVLKRTVCFGESDSLIVVGPKGCGKSLLVNTCLEDLELDEQTAEAYSTVKLHGLVHTDDNLALKDIIQQLHVDELEGDRVTGSFADNLLFVLQSLESGDRKSSKAIIFILDEFELFCDHRNQTLLYNLFDVAQSAQAPICVVGLTCRGDVIELLEKRVKSRFSHRQISLFYNTDLSQRKAVVASYLTLPYSVTDQQERLLPYEFVKAWNDSAKEALEDETVTSLLKRLLQVDPSEKTMKNILFRFACEIDADTRTVTAKRLKDVFKRQINVDMKKDLLKDLSVLEICMVIAMKHHCDIYDGEPFNFEMVLKQYLKFASQNMGHQVTQKPILYKVFERLKDLELIQPVGGASKTYKKEFQLFTFNLLHSQVNEAVQSYVGLPTDVSHWATSNPTA
ncbi:Origin recognition complex subunit [Nesidiocoris tenuis]|uniref:Origin recognition complex subunit 4 n=1 Tax=Nesidiocoris tenuis TaxID=355587 RepID=A0ABN7ANF6_9HEMI|nr:Origin recognition complex subunit [Nesidiocoris tenuis]